MGAAASLPGSVPNSMRMTRLGANLGASSISTLGTALPPPITLNTEEEALAVGYTNEEILLYKSSYEYFERMNQERGFANVSLPLKPHNMSHIDPSAAGKIHVENGPMQVVIARKPDIVGSNIVLSAVRGGGRKAADPSYWDKLGGLHRISNQNDFNKIINDLNVGGLQTGLKAIVIGSGMLVINLVALLLKNRFKDVTVVYATERIGKDVGWTVNMELYYMSLWRTLGIQCISSTIVTGIKFDDEAGWVQSVQLKSGVTLPGNLIVVAEQNENPNENPNENQEVEVKVRSGEFSTGKGSWRWISVGNVLDGDQIEFAVGNIETVLKQQIQFENARLLYNQQRRREKQGLGKELIVSGQTPRNTVQVRKSFGSWVIRNDVVIGAFLEGGSAEENEYVVNVVRTKASWPLQ